MDPDWYYHENQDFHRLIYAGSHNSFLEQQAAALHRRLSPYRRLQLRVPDRVPRSFNEHEGIVSALISGQAEQAAELLRAHIIVQGERFADLLASLAGLRDGDAWRRALADSGKVATLRRRGRQVRRRRRTARSKGANQLG
jgi:DNA-binding GntR family transcriptional regulator